MKRLKFEHSCKLTESFSFKKACDNFGGPYKTNLFTWKITNDFYLTFHNKSNVDQPTPLLRNRFSLLRMDSLPSEFSLKCNVLKCSRKLIDEAWITSCGHIFCVDCGSVKLDQLPVLCPRCSTHFSSPFDVMISDLNPPSHFKKVKTTFSLNLVNPSC